MSKGAQITLAGISRRYADASRTLDVIRDVSFVFEAGGRYSIMGRSGVGKSTLLHLLGALDRPTSGDVLFDAQSLMKLSVDELATFRGRNVGFVFQFHQLLGEFSAEENVAMPLFIAGQDEASARATSRAMLERVGLSGRLTHRPGELSGGEQQRVAIARALVTKPRVVLADEPTGNLDLATSQEIQAMLLELHAEQRFTLIAVTHHQDLAQGLGTVLEMQPGGRLVVH